MEARFEAGQAPQSFDKDFIRSCGWLSAAILKTDQIRRSHRI